MHNLLLVHALFTVCSYGIHNSSEQPLAFAAALASLTTATKERTAPAFRDMDELKMQLKREAEWPRYYCLGVLWGTYFDFSAIAAVPHVWESSQTWYPESNSHSHPVFSRLNGSYESLKGGSTIEAMEDFTGGIGEMYDVKVAPDNFYEILEKALKRCSMVGCSIDVSKKGGLNFSVPSALGSIFSGLSFSFSPDEVCCLQRLVKFLLNSAVWCWAGWWDPSPSSLSIKTFLLEMRLCVHLISVWELRLRSWKCRRCWNKITGAEEEFHPGTTSFLLWVNNA